MYFVKFQYAFLCEETHALFRNEQWNRFAQEETSVFPWPFFETKNSGIRGSRGITEEGKEKERRGRLFETDLRIYEPRHRLPVTLALREI